VTLRVVDPRGGRPCATEAYALRLTTDRCRIALLSNAFPDATRFLVHLGEGLRQVSPSIEIRLYEKSTAVGAAPTELIDRIATESDAAVSAYGH
jgi:hypothetical protein